MQSIVQIMKIRAKMTCRIEMHTGRVMDRFLSELSQAPEGRIINRELRVPEICA